ncbi:MAG: hypothetical protein F4X64_01685 [Chloroflexi bacterium]|nr:hypothetical protein [Chloroflexota bacterium]
MTTSRIIVALSVIAVLGVVAATSALSFTAAPTAAQESTPPPPEATPEPVSAEDAETLAEMKQHCRDGEIYDLYFSVNDADDEQGKTLLLEWWADLSYWDLPDGMVAYYRIQRRDVDGGEWQTVATVNNTNVWEGSVETGHWDYRVGLLGLVSGDLIHECQTTQWAEAIINVLTPQEELERFCETTYVSHVETTVKPSSEGRGEIVTLEWWIDYRYHYPGYDIYEAPPDGTEAVYRVELTRAARNESEYSWETVGEVSGAEAWVNRETWSHTGEPGNWIYRVALVSLQAGDLVAQCKKPQWEEVAVFVPTAEERAKAEADRLVLIGQASDCALDALSDNLNPDARSVIGEYIEKRVSLFVEDAKFEDVVVLTVMFCTDREVRERSREPSRVEYILDVLFDVSYY